MKIQISKDILRSIRLIQKHKLFYVDGLAKDILTTNNISRISRLAELRGKDKKLLGWSVVIDGNKLMTFVDPSVRRLGYGTKLSRRAKRGFASLGVCVANADDIGRHEFWKKVDRNLKPIEYNDWFLR